MTQPATPLPPKTPSHLLPFVFGNILLLLANVGLGAYSVMRSNATGSDAKRMGGYFGVFLVLALAVGIVNVVARVVRRTKRPRFVVVTFFTLGICFVGQAAVAVSSVMSSMAFTPAERGGLVITADSISHPTLGFSAPNPHGAFSPSAVLQHRMDSSFVNHHEITAWALNSPTHGNVIIEATKLSQMGELTFRTYIAEFRRGAIRRADAVLEDSLTWTTRGEYRLMMRVRTAFVRTRCLSRAGDVNLIVCLQAASADTTGLDEVPAGLVLKE